MSDFGDFLRGKRIERGFSINKLALKSGISNAHISRMERGLRPPPNPKTLKYLAEALNINYPEMLKEAGHLSKDSLGKIDIADIISNSTHLDGTPLNGEEKKNLRRNESTLIDIIKRFTK